MASKASKRGLNRVAGRLQLILLAALVGVAGSLALLISHAGTPTGSLEAESGNVAGAAASQADAAASGGNTVLFGGPPAMPQAVPAGYSRTFGEDFDTPAAPGTFKSVYSSQFKDYGDVTSTNKITRYSPDKVVSVSHGSMFYNLHTEGTADNYTSYAAAELPAVHGNYLNFTYGQYGMAVKLHSYSGTGFKIAFLLWPANNVWTNEVDFPETDPDFSKNVSAGSFSDPAQRGGAHRSSGNFSTGTYLTDDKYHYFLLDWQRPVAVSVAAASDTVTFSTPPTTSYAVGDTIECTDVANADPLATDTTYYVRSIAGDGMTMTLATTSGGPAIDFTADGTAQAAMPMTAYLDGVKVYQWRREVSIPRQPMHLVLQSEGWLKRDANNQYIAPPFGAAAELEVPWVYVNTQN